MQRPLASHVSEVHTLSSVPQGVEAAAGVPPHFPAWQLSDEVQSLPSSHVVPSATGLPLHVPPWQVSGLVQSLRSSQAVPS
jgi:hypothetical protein